MAEFIKSSDLEERPEKNHIWAAAEVHAENMDIHTARPDHPKRELWYVPTCSIWDAHKARKIFERYGIERVVDLGAGDCRFSLWCDREGYDVIAYELNYEIASSVNDRFDLGGIDLRVRDYHDDYDELISAGTAVVAFGGTNTLPHPPNEGIGIEGYSEIGVKCWHSGELVATW